MKSRFSLIAVRGVAVITASASISLQAADKIDFSQQVKPLLEANCLSCHGPEKPKGRLRLDTRAAAIKGGESGTALVPGKSSESPLYGLTILPAGDDKIMPPKGQPLSKEQTEILKQWIDQGAEWPENVTLQKVHKVDFVKDVQPILEFSCVACHQEGHAKGGLRLDKKDLALKGSESGPVIVPGKADSSKLYTSTVLPADRDDLMPPKSKGGPLPKDKTEMLRDWINQGAVWPDGITLTPKKVEVAGGDEMATVTQIHQAIMGKLNVKTQAEMKKYTENISGTEVEFDMIPIQAGEFVMGTPDSERGHQPSESPQHKVAVDAFWMGKCEVTWNEYELFMYSEEERKIRSLRKYDPSQYPGADAVSRPTTPYVEMSFGMGKDGYPAISMTQHAANKYCEWLSAKTGHFYRLPTEAEWEYACRAGTTTAYSFGDDASKLDDYAWYGRNSDGKYQKVGEKKPNPWGLYDMHGNVMEWTLDQYDPEYYKTLGSATASNPWNKAAKPYPHVARGGAWSDEDALLLRSGARIGSDKSWKQQDPQLPKSIWYLTDAQFVGFRVIRPLKVPSPEELHKYWTSGVEKD